MALVLVGINHTTAKIALRETVAFPPEILGEALKQLWGLSGIDGVVIVSPCNRTEVYMNFDSGEQEDSGGSKVEQNRLLIERQQSIVEWLAGYHEIDASELASRT